jgi:hypothetical protein
MIAIKIFSEYESDHLLKGIGSVYIGSLACVFELEKIGGPF